MRLTPHALALLLTLPALALAEGAEHVVLLHGLLRSPVPMKRLEKKLSAEGYIVWNLGYPSRCHPIETLATDVRARIAANTASATKVHVVTHSLGGILVRYIQQHEPLPNLGRVVMLSPPNQGSEVVAKLGHLKLFAWINGPAGRQLGTSPDSLPNQLGPADFELGIITGDRSINWINSWLIPGRDDGKVAVERAKVEGMRDFKVIHASHPFIMMKQAAIEDAIHFLQNGHFTGHGTPSSPGLY